MTDQKWIAKLTKISKSLDKQIDEIVLVLLDDKVNRIDTINHGSTKV